jgi:hypothetical protein
MGVEIAILEQLIMETWNLFARNSGFRLVDRCGLTAYKIAVASQL